MVDPPFTVGLRLSIEVASKLVAGDTGSLADWRDRLRAVRFRERTFRRLPDNVVPDEHEVARVLAQTFAEHPMVHVARRARAQSVDAPRPGAPGAAYVIAEIALLPDLAADPPGSTLDHLGNTYPDSVIGDPVLVHMTAWRHEPHSAAEIAAADDLLAEISAEIPRILWRNS
jgi:hypothetical protein